MNEDKVLLAALAGARRMARKDMQNAFQQFEIHPNGANYTAVLECTADYQAATYEYFGAVKERAARVNAKNWAASAKYRGTDSAFAEWTRTKTFA